MEYRGVKINPVVPDLGDLEFYKRETDESIDAFIGIGADVFLWAFIVALMERVEALESEKGEQDGRKTD